MHTPSFSEVMSLKRYQLLLLFFTSEITHLHHLKKICLQETVDMYNGGRPMGGVDKADQLIDNYFYKLENWELEVPGTWELV